MKSHKKTSETVTKKTIASGGNSQNIQAETVNITVLQAPEDLSALGRQLMQKDLSGMTSMASEEAKSRAAVLSEAYLKALAASGKVNIDFAKEPSYQHSLYDAHVGYTKNPTDETLEILVDVLIERSEENLDSLYRNVLEDSIVVAPKLTQKQLNALSLVLVIGNATYFSVTNQAKFKEFFKEHILPLANEVSVEPSTFLHLEYLGCCNTSVMSYDLVKSIRAHYSGIFSKGFSMEDISGLPEEKEVILPLIDVCINDKDKYQFKALNESNLKERLHAQLLGDEVMKSAISLHNDSTLNEIEMRAKLELMLGDDFTALLDLWSESGFTNMRLTSVGLLLGHINFKKRTGQTINVAAFFKE